MKDFKEITEKELKEIDGGSWKRLLGPAGLVFAALETDWDKVWGDLNRGWGDGHIE